MTPAEYRSHLRRQLTQIEYCIRIRNEELTKLNGKKERLLSLLKNAEGAD